MARRAPPVPPYRAQLATLVAEAPAGGGLVHEVKYDGYRIGAALEAGRATLWSRRGKDWTAQFPAIAAAVAALPARAALLDGEVAAVLPDGRTSFQALQNAAAGGAGRIVYFVFDLLFLDGEDLSGRPLLERKAALARLVRGAGDLVRYAEHVETDGPTALAAACRLGLEGIVSKRADAPYRPGRNALWVKAKCIQRQELVIGGFTLPEGQREGIGALLVGHHEGGALRFAGKVGTGFTNASARALRDRLERRLAARPPFDPAPRGWLGKHARWVRPELVAEVAFTEWTTDGKIRHPSFQGLREDKRPEEVVRERPAGASAPPAPAAPGVATPKLARGRAAPGQRARGRGARGPAQASGPTVAGVRISSADRVVYPELGLTKLELARYHEAVADAMLPHLAGRPLTLFHCPDGLAGECRFMKHSKVWAPAAVRRVRIPEKTKLGEYLVVDTAEALVSTVQMDVVELHTWNSTVDRLEEPDRLVLDLDPGPDVPFADVIRAAFTARAALEALGLAAFVKTTGGAGLHVVAPLVPEARWELCLGLARGIAGALVRHDPRRFTSAYARRGRERKILVDYLRNNRTNTSVAAFSARARPHAPVSVPLAWDELEPRLDPARFTVRTVPRRLARLREDPWAGWARAARPLPTVVTVVTGGDAGAGEEAAP